MGSKQGGETRKMNDFLRSLEADSFNLGLENTMAEEDKICAELEIEQTYITPKRKTVFHKRMKELMKDKKTNKTQLGRDIAKAIGRKKPIARQTLDNYMDNRSQPTIDILIYLCEHFGVTPNYLLGYDKYVTLEDKYIGETLGLTQENINYLRARNKNENDTVIAAVNLLLKDSYTYVKETKAKKANKQTSVEKGKNVLVLLYQYLNVQRDTSMVSFAQQDWNVLATQIERNINELNLDTQDQKISYYREKTQELKSIYDKLLNEKRVSSLRSDIMVTSYYQRLENAIKGLRKVLQQQEGL